MEYVHATKRYAAEKTQAVINHRTIVPFRQGVSHVWNGTAGLEETITYQVLSISFNIVFPIFLGLLSSGIMAAMALLLLEIAKFAAPKGIYWIGGGIDYQIRSFFKWHKFPWTETIYQGISFVLQWSLWGINILPRVWSISTAPFKAAVGFLFGSITFLISRYFFSNRELQAASYFFIRYTSFKMYDTHSQERSVRWRSEDEETVQIWRTTNGFEWMNRVIERKQHVENQVIRRVRVERLAQVIRQEQAFMQWCRKWTPELVFWVIERPQRWNMVVAAKIEQWLLQFCAPNDPYRLVREVYFQRISYEASLQHLAVQQAKVVAAQEALERAASQERERACTAALKAVEQVKAELAIQTKRLHATWMHSFPLKVYKSPHQYPAYLRVKKEEAAAEASCDLAQQSLARRTLEYEAALHARDTMRYNYKSVTLTKYRKALESAIQKERICQKQAHTAKECFKRGMGKTPLGKKQLFLEASFDAWLEHDFDTEQAWQAKKCYQRAKANLLKQGSKAYGEHIQRQYLSAECHYEQAYQHFLEKNLQQNGYILETLQIQKGVEESRLARLRSPTDIDSTSLVGTYFNKKKSAELIALELANCLIVAGYLDTNSKGAAIEHLQRAYSNRAFSKRQNELAHRVDQIKYTWSRTPSIEAQEKVVAGLKKQEVDVTAEGNTWKHKKAAVSLRLATLNKEYTTVGELSEAGALALRLKEKEAKHQAELLEVQTIGRKQLVDTRQQIEEQRREEEVFLQEVRNFVPVRQKKLYKVVFQVVKGQGISLAVGWLSGPAQMAVIAGQILLAMKHNQERGHSSFRAFRMAATSIIAPTCTVVAHNVKHKQYKDLCMQLAMTAIDKTAGSKGEFLKINKGTLLKAGVKMTTAGATGGKHALLQQGILSAAEIGTTEGMKAVEGKAKSALGKAGLALRNDTTAPGYGRIGKEPSVVADTFSKMAHNPSQVENIVLERILEPINKPLNEGLERLGLRNAAPVLLMMEIPVEEESSAETLPIEDFSEEETASEQPLEEMLEREQAEFQEWLTQLPHAPGKDCLPGHTVDTVTLCLTQEQVDALHGVVEPRAQEETQKGKQEEASTSKQKKEIFTTVLREEQASALEDFFRSKNLEERRAAQQENVSVPDKNKSVATTSEDLTQASSSVSTQKKSAIDLQLCYMQAPAPKETLFDKSINAVVSAAEFVFIESIFGKNAHASELPVQAQQGAYPRCNSEIRTLPTNNTAERYMEEIGGALNRQGENVIHMIKHPIETVKELSGSLLDAAVYIKDGYVVLFSTAGIKLDNGAAAARLLSSVETQNLIFTAIREADGPQRAGIATEVASVAATGALTGMGIATGIKSVVKKAKSIANTIRGKKALPQGNAIKTRHGYAIQGTSEELIQLRKDIQKKGAVLFRVGTDGISETKNAQYWATTPAITENFAKVYGIPSENIKDLNMSMQTTLPKNSTFIVRKAAPSGRNRGGAPEVVLQEGTREVEITMYPHIPKQKEGLNWPALVQPELAGVVATEQLYFEKRKEQP